MTYGCLSICICLLAAWLTDRAPGAPGVVGRAAVNSGAAGARVLQRDGAAGPRGVAAHPRVGVVYPEQAVHLCAQPGSLNILRLCCIKTYLNRFLRNCKCQGLCSAC